MPENIPPPFKQDEPAQQHGPQNAKPDPKHSAPSKTTRVVTNPSFPAIDRKPKSYCPSKNTLITWFTGVVAVAAILQAIVTCKQWSVMDETMKRAERAWLTIFQYKVDLPKIGDAPSDVAEIQNTGRSPARDIRLKHGIYLWENLPDGPIDSVNIMEDESRNLLGPSIHTGVGARGTHVIDDARMTYLKNGKLRIYSIGTITYTDIFSETHRTDFCSVVANVDTGDTKPCPKWNDAN